MTEIMSMMLLEVTCAGLDAGSGSTRNGGADADMIGGGASRQNMPLDPKLWGTCKPEP